MFMLSRLWAIQTYLAPKSDFVRWPVRANGCESQNRQNAARRSLGASTLQGHFGQQASWILRLMRICAQTDKNDIDLDQVDEFFRNLRMASWLRRKAYLCEAFVPCTVPRRRMDGNASTVAPKLIYSSRRDVR